MNTCETCRYWNAQNRDTKVLYFGEQKEYRECRRNAPVITMAVAAWPSVKADDWCGQWKEKPEVTDARFMALHNATKVTLAEPITQPIPSQCQHEWDPFKGPHAMSSRCKLCGETCGPL